jgi:salicylate hydroxylase
MTDTTAESAFARFERIRRPRIERVARTSRANGFAFHLEWPFTLARDAALLAMGRNGQLRRLSWIYGYDAAPEIEATAPARV